MAKVLPFKAYRPTEDKVQLTVSKAVESYDKAEINFHLRRNPYSFLNVIKANHGRIQKLKGSALFKQIKSNFDEFVAKNIFIKDEQDCYYVYQQINEDFQYTGIIALASAEDYHNDIIKKHEQTLTKREETLKEYLVDCPINAEPICFTYPDHPIINQCLVNQVKNKPNYFFTDIDQVTHKLWKISNPSIVTELQNAFEEIPSVYIADGHHRSAASALYALERKNQNEAHSGNESYNAYMGIFFPESELKIFEFNRVVRDMNGLTKTTLIQALSKSFSVEKIKYQKPKCAHEITMYLEKEWFSLKCLLGSFDEKDSVKSLDSYILSENVLSPIFDIQDLKKDKRVQFVSGVYGPEKLVEKVDKGLVKVAFCLYPVSMEQLKAVADSGGNMPPKSTWVEPKLKSALTIYTMED